MKVFDFVPADYLEQYGEQHWVHIHNGITPEFHDYLLRFLETELEAHLLDGFAIKGKKEQALFEFPPGENCLDEVFDVIAKLCGLDRSRMVLSERHIQAYEANAAPEPVAHKDRYPSQVSVGLSIKIPETSRLVLYPDDYREINVFNRAADLNRHLQPDSKPEAVLPRARELELDDHDRDVVVFPGSSTWHLRRRSAGAVNVYLKVNDFGCDPLGEDPTTAQLREQTLSAVSKDDGYVEDMVPVLARRLDSVTRGYTRDDWQEVLQARVFGEEPFGITDQQWTLLRAVNGRRSVGELTGALSVSGDGTKVRSDLLYLAVNGALDLRSSER
jgi:hypothetical protein